MRSSHQWYIEPSFLGKYCIGKTLGKGGFGVVYGGRRKKDGAPIAVKHVPKRRNIKLTSKVSYSFINAIVLTNGLVASRLTGEKYPRNCSGF